MVQHQYHKYCSWETIGIILDLASSEDSVGKMLRKINLLMNNTSMGNLREKTP